MAYSPPYQYQWQNPELCEDIYPFRLEKLRDFLLYYKEADLWATSRTAAVNSRLALELVQAYNDLTTRIADAKRGIEDALRRQKELELKNREFVRNPNIRLLEQQRINLKNKLPEKQSRIRTLTTSLTWYTNYSKDHPEVLELAAYKKRAADLAAENAALQALQQELAKVQASYQAEMEKAGLGSLEAMRTQTLDEIERLRVTVRTTTEELRRLPRLGKSGEVTPGAAARWLVKKYENELRSLPQERLIELILERFKQQPQRFPKWLQYMVIHFSGMRYKSAHGSWASPRDLVETLAMEEQEQWVRTSPPAALEQAATQAQAMLRQKKAAIADPRAASQVDSQITALANPSTRPTALLKIRTAQAVEAARQMSDDQALERLKAMRDQFPDWMWKEIVSRTGLRLETTDTDWESLTPAQQQQRWSEDSQRWRGIMDTWERKDITGWRKQHELTLSLVVTRAVCNEIAEHIQHLRGIKPAAGLTAKPEWYIRMQRTAAAPAGNPNADRPFFKPPGTQTRTDFKTGASILWLGWVDRKPNPWQITHPLTGVSTLPPREEGALVSWSYQMDGTDYIRVSQVKPPKGGEKKGPRPGRVGVKNWLRWTHEAIVVEVAQMADGRDYVITFETGQIGLRLRSLGELLNNPFVYIGYVPPASVPVTGLDPMLAPATLLPEEMAEAAPVSFELPTAVAEPVIEVDETLRIWESLTRREQQVVAMICRELSTRAISEQMEISQSTVKGHLANAMKKFGVHSRGELRRKLRQAQKQDTR